MVYTGRPAGHAHGAAEHYTARMQWSPGLDRAPSRRTLATWCDVAMPGWRPVAVRRLRGGLDTAMHAVDLIAPTGERRRVVLKRFDPLHTGRSVAHACRRMWQTLKAVERLELPAPRPVWSDAEGAVFGTAALVLTWVPGHVEWRPADPRAWAERLAGALVAIHRAPVDGIDLELLPRVDGQVDRDLAKLERDATVLDRHPDGADVRGALRRLRPSVRPSVHGGSPVLNHGDFHAGNVLWRRGRLVAVVDWDHAAVGVPGADVGLARLALALQHSPDAAADFLRAYEVAAGRAIPHLAFWDLLAGALAIRYFDLWVASMDAFGRRDVSPTELRRRLDAFIGDALARR
jgi:aminoglycoside phosphotransferase (APT) family kinase protein